MWGRLIGGVGRCMKLETKFVVGEVVVLQNLFGGAAHAVGIKNGMEGVITEELEGRTGVVPYLCYGVSVNGIGLWVGPECVKGVLDWVNDV